MVSLKKQCNAWHTYGLTFKDKCAIITDSIDICKDAYCVSVSHRAYDSIDFGIDNMISQYPSVDANLESYMLYGIHRVLSIKDYLCDDIEPIAIRKKCKLKSMKNYKNLKERRARWSVTYP